MTKRIPIFLFVVLALGLALAARPAGAGELFSIVPDSASPGDSLQIVISAGQDDVFILPAVVNFDPGTTITTDEPILLDTNAIVTTIQIPEATEGSHCGLQDVTVVDQITTYNGQGLFEVVCGTSQPLLISVGPDSAYAGQALQVTVTGVDTHFEEGISSLSFSGTGITVNSTSVVAATALTAQISIDQAAAAGSRDVSVTTGDETANGAGMFTVEEPQVEVTPSSGMQGSTLPSVTIHGGPGTFSSGTGVSFGEGITIGSQASPDGQTLVLSDVTLAVNAPVGPHDLVLNSPALQQPGAFIVVQGPGTLLLSIDPDHGDRGHPGLLVSLIGQNTHFDAADVSVSLSADNTRSTDLDAGDPTQLDAKLVLGSLSQEGLTDVSVALGLASGCDNCEKVTLSNGFEITTPGTLTGISPAMLEADGSINVEITASDGQFIQGETDLVISPPDGIEVSALTVTDADHLSATLDISADASGQPRNATAVTGTEVALGEGLIDVFRPAIDSVIPPSGLVGTMVPVTITGQDVVFEETNEVLFSGTGISVSGPVVNPDETNKIKVSLTIAADAEKTARDVTVKMGSVELTAAGAFQVSSLPIKPPDGGCGCVAAAPSTPVGLLGLLFLLLIVRRRN
ncbi:MAG TPA: MYXO-CTERM sorting domain-containing protein [Myxococcota bacterium]|nr:MYXO-CTERM sorting domain-containing protein [Myxococcota bacterium]